MTFIDFFTLSLVCAFLGNYERDHRRMCWVWYANAVAWGFFAVIKIFDGPLFF